MPTTPNDLEAGRGQDEKPKPFDSELHQISAYIARNSNKAGAIFRRYDSLAVYKILRLSQELRELEMRQERIILDGHPASSALEDKITKVLHDYYELLTLYSKVLHLKSPAKRTIKGLDRHITDNNLYGHRLQAWSTKQNKDVPYPDLASLYTPAEDDNLSRFAARFLPRLFLDTESTTKDKYLNEERLQKGVTFTGALFAIAFLIGAMWVLWRVGDHMVAKLAIITGFVVAFASWIGFFASAERKELITATAAYAAVLVVYVSKG